jgi:hypothetical protein
MPNISRARWKADEDWMRASWRALAEKKEVDTVSIFLHFSNYEEARSAPGYAIRRALCGAEPRLAIPRLLLSAHPTGMIAGEVQEELEIPASTLSHHLGSCVSPPRNHHKKIGKAKTRNRRQRKSASAFRAASDSPAALDSAGLFPEWKIFLARNE